jgi:hypothetical protein
MSSLTKTEFISELKTRSNLVSTFSDSDVGDFVDISLRKYSERLPKLKWDIENDVVAGQELYNYPTGALRIISVRNSDGRDEIEWAIEDQGSGNQIRVGNVVSKSYDDLLEKDFYQNPVVFNKSATVDLDVIEGIATEEYGYSQFDIEYAILQTVPTIAEEGLEAISHYVKYLCASYKSEESTLNMTDVDNEIPGRIIDSDSSGASTTIEFATQKDVANSFSNIAEKELEKFLNLTENNTVYGTRG